MSKTTETVTKGRLILLTAAGLVTWLGMLVAGSWFSLPQRVTLAELLLLLHVLVLSPSVVFLLASRNGDRFALRWAVALQPAAMISGGCAHLTARGWEGLLVVLPYVAFTGLVALHCALRFLERSGGGPGAFRFTETCVDASGVFLVVGGIWLALDRFASIQTGFASTIVQLTAVHFHFAGCSAALITGLVGRVLVSNGGVLPGPFALASSGALLGPVLTALGIAFSRRLEVSGAVIFALSMCALAVSLVAVAVLPRVRMVARVLLVPAALGLLVAMGLAIVFAVSTATGRPMLSIPDMVRTHGVLNAGLFAAGATLALLLLPAPPVCREPPPFSRLRAGLRVGGDFFDRRGLVLPASRAGKAAPTPQGLCDSLDSFRGQDLDPDRLPPEIRRFYEETARYRLDVRARWSALFRLPGLFYKPLSRRMGQMNFPTGGGRPEERMDSRILPLSDEADGRSNVRAWVRTFETTGECIYAAAYSQHRDAGRTYMNIAFALPGVNLTSILRLSNCLADDGTEGLELTTRPPPGEVPGGEGIYLVLPFGQERPFGIRLPMNETIVVRAGGLAARHEMWLCGHRFLTLHYEMERVS